MKHIKVVEYSWDEKIKKRNNGLSFPPTKKSKDSWSELIRLYDVSLIWFWWHLTLFENIIVEIQLLLIPYLMVNGLCYYCYTVASYHFDSSTN